MLISLNIRNLAVVKHLDLEFQSGFTALTGETGAGKSILLTALGLALGERANPDIVRKDSDKAEIVLEFDLSAALEVRQWLQANDLDAGQTCLIRRSVAGQGRSRAFLNDHPVSLQTLQDLARQLVEIHGQHAHLHLLHGNAQRQLVDAHANNAPLLQQCLDRYRHWRATRQQLASIQQSAADQNLREEFLRFQIQELEEADIDHLDFDALIEEHVRLANLDKILTGVQSQCHQLFEADYAVELKVDQGARELESLAELAPELQEVSELLRQAQIQLDEAGQSLRRIVDGLEADPARLEQLEKQLSELHHLARKHQVSVEELPLKLAQMREELDGLAHQEQRLASLADDLDRLDSEYRELATELSERRHQSARTLGRRITELMRELGMPHGEFAIRMTTDPQAEPRPEGLDQIEFLVTTNPGVPPRPLAKVASGGELSRLSLAIKVACGENKPVPTLIFDEVDTGIGGGVAEIVGQRLRELGQHRQVLCVTHLPQVAAQAHHHLRVSKASDQSGAETRVEPLSSKDRQREIARMLGGIKITEQTLAHAEEMLQWRQE